MAKYLFMGTYTREGLQALKEDAATARREAVSRLAASLGGQLESFYFAFGETDTFVVLDLPSPEAAAAAAFAVNSSGAATDTTTVLLTPEQVDAARDLTPVYRPPGGSE